MDDVWSVQPVGHGFNLVGMPGDYSPPSRFVRPFYLRQVTDQKRLQFASQLGHLTASQLHPRPACFLQCDGVIGFWLECAWWRVVINVVTPILLGGTFAAISQN